MIEFHSGSSNAVNSKATILECIDHAFVDGDKANCKLLVIHSTVGHNFAQMAASPRKARIYSKILKPIIALPSP